MAKQTLQLTMSDILILPASSASRAFSPLFQDYFDLKSTFFTFNRIFLDFRFFFVILILGANLQFDKTKEAFMKKLLKAICISLFAISILLGSSLEISYASNHSDEVFLFLVSPGIIGKSGYRNKEDSSGVYVNYQSGPAGIVFYVLSPDNQVQNSGTGAAVMYVGQQRRIHTHVYENGYTSCALASNNSTATGYASGLWSPDSVGTYPWAN